MKKGFFTLITGLVALGASAQTGVKNTNKMPVNNGYEIKKHGDFLTPNGANGGQMSQWFSYASLQVDLNGFEAGSLLLFPDSSPVIAFLSSGNPTQNHNTWCSAGQSFDPKDAEFSLDGNTEILSKFNAYTIDSINVLYLYERDLHTVTDTMIVTFHKSGASTATGAMSNWYWGTTAGNNWSTTDYNRAIKEPAMSATVYQIRVPLNELDSNANGGVWGEKKFAIPASFKAVPKGATVGVTVTFKPGYSYNFGDTLQASEDLVPQPTKKFNRFWVRTVRNGSTVENVFYNNGMMVDKNQAYTDRLAALGSKYLPSSFYVTSQLVHVEYLVNSPNVGVKNVNANGYGLGDIYPNPASAKGNVSVPFTIGNAGDVNVTITNIVGQTVLNTTENFSAGEHTLDLGLNNLKAGVYFYTVTSGNFTATKKFTVGE